MRRHEVGQSYNRIMQNMCQDATTRVRTVWGFEELPITLAAVWKYTSSLPSVHSSSSFDERSPDRYEGLERTGSEVHVV